MTMTLFCAVQEQIKGLITGLMLSTPPVVRAQLSEALSIISEHDFPTRWQDLLPQLIDRLKAGDATTTNGVLETLNSIYKRYRSQFMTGKLNDELKYSQQLIVPLWETLKGLSLQLQSNSADLSRTKQTLSSIRLVCRIFYSLNSPGLTQVKTRKCMQIVSCLKVTCAFAFLCILSVVTFLIKSVFASAGNGGHIDRVVCRVSHIFGL